MQRKIHNEVQLGKTVSPFYNIGQSSSIDRTGQHRTLQMRLKNYKT